MSNIAIKAENLSKAVLLNGQLGQMINPNSQEEIINAIKIAIANKDHHAKNQRALALENFGFDGYIEKIKNLITK